MKKARTLQKELSNELLKLEKTQQQQAENDALLKELNNQVVEVKKEIENSTDRINKLRGEFQQLDDEKSELETQIKNKEAEEKARLEPEIDRYKKLIKDMEDKIKGDEEQIEKEHVKCDDILEKIDGLDKVKEDEKEKYDLAQ